MLRGCSLCGWTGEVSDPPNYNNNKTKTIIHLTQSELNRREREGVTQTNTYRAPEINAEKAEKL